MKKLLLSALMLAGTLTFAQDGKLTISGTVDVYGGANLDEDKAGNFQDYCLIKTQMVLELVWQTQYFLMKQVSLVS